MYGRYDNSFLKILAQKYPNKALLVPNSGIFALFLDTLQLDKFKGADFKYDNSFFLISSPKISKYSIFGQKYPNKALLVPNLSIFVSSQNFAITQIRRC